MRFDLAKAEHAPGHLLIVFIRIWRAGVCRLGSGKIWVVLRLLLPKVPFKFVKAATFHVLIVIGRVLTRLEAATIAAVLTWHP